MKVYRYFGAFLKAQEKWLNKMADDGYRLIDTKNCSYEFEFYSVSQYKYRVFYIGDKSEEWVENHRKVLENAGIRTFIRRIGWGYPVKLRWLRKLLGVIGLLAESHESQNDGLLIIEQRKDGMPYEINLEVDTEAVIKYYKNNISQYLWYGLLLTIVAIMIFSQKNNDNVLYASIIALFALYDFIKGFIYWLAIRHMKKE